MGQFTMSMIQFFFNNTYSEPRLEQLFEAVKEEVIEKKQTILTCRVDALIAEQEGHGTWGICQSVDDSLSFYIWFQADMGTVLLKPDGSFEMNEVEDEVTWNPEEDEDTYDHFYRILSEVLPEDILPPKLDAPAEELPLSVDEDEDTIDEDD